MTIRLIDAQDVSGLRSQSIYHALAYARTSDTPDTIVFVNSKDPCVCIGYHQDLKDEVNVAYCQSEGLPVLRREVGGGTVYLDHRQLFVQWVFDPAHLPWKIDKRFELFIYPIVKTYQALGINAYLQPINDVQVGGKKITGTGAGAIGNAEVMVGNFLFDFDYERMAQALRVPDEKYRDKIYQGMRFYVTTVEKELGYIPDRQSVIEIYIEACKNFLGKDMEFGDFTAEELRAMEEIDRKFTSEGWLYQKGRSKFPTVKIHTNVWVTEVSYEAQAGLIRLAIRTQENVIDDISISGSFPFFPRIRLAEFERSLLGIQLDNESIKSAVQTFYTSNHIQSPGLEVDDWVQAILQVKEKLKKVS